MIFVYLVCGSSGEYDDLRTWYVKAFEVEEDANRYVERLQRRVERLRRISEFLVENDRETPPRSRFFDTFGPIATRLDPSMVWGYPVPSYFVSPVEVIHGKR